jgi:hypothetical protein
MTQIQNMYIATRIEKVIRIFLIVVFWNLDIICHLEIVFWDFSWTFCEWALLC